MAQDQKEGGMGHEILQIFVNRRKFSEGDGVKSAMTGAEISKLVEVPAENAVIRLETGPDRHQEIAADETIKIKNGMHFLVTRKVVEGGYESRAH